MPPSFENVVPQNDWNLIVFPKIHTGIDHATCEANYEADIASANLLSIGHSFDYEVDTFEMLDDSKASVFSDARWIEVLSSVWGANDECSQHNYSGLSEALD